MTRMFSRDVAIALAIVLASLATRAIFDKLLALSPDMTLVAHWAQAQGLFELTGAVALAGVGQGLVVFAARRDQDEHVLMRDAIAWSLVVSGGAALALLVATPWINAATGREVAPNGAVGALAIGAGLLSTAPALFQLFWQGRRQRGKMLALILAGWAPMALGASGLLGDLDISALMRIQIATQAALTLVLCAPVARTMLKRRAQRKPGAKPASWLASPLRRYILAGLSIGLMSPASTMWARAELAHALSWAEVAQLQALWRTSEWVIGLASGLLALVFLPRMAAATSSAAFHLELTRTWRVLCAPAAIVLVALWAGQGVALPLLYSDKFIMPAAASALFLAGDAIRLASWAPLQGLFATERVTAIAIGEWLSLPLFALLLTIAPNPSLIVAGACYLVTYTIYFAFNVWCVYRLPGRYATAAA